jgi:site-specific DNA-cytosine methylase
MKILELFSGTESFSNVARERGHEVFTIDIDKSFHPSLAIDVLSLEVSMIPEEFRNPDIVWASPPCTTFSVASLRHYWKEGKPKNAKTLHGIMIVEKTLKIIRELNPHFFVIENPRGMLRKQSFMNGLHRNTVTYCQYGAKTQKPTDLWNNLNHQFKPCCKPGSICHEAASRGVSKGVQGINNSFSDLGSKGKVRRAIVPRELCLEIIKACEESQS